jgi:hypothetical protein
MPSPARSSSSRLAAAAIALGLLLCTPAGCTTERIIRSEGGPLPPEPRPLPAVPAGVVPTQMAFVVGSKPQDANGNGFPDLVAVTVYLFAPPHRAAIEGDGTIVVSMYAMGQFGQPDVEPLAVWTRGGAELQAARVRALYGLGYQFQLSLLEGGSDVFPLSQVDLVCRFEPLDGSPPIHSTGVRTIQIGRRRARALAGP